MRLGSSTKKIGTLVIFIVLIIEIVMGIFLFFIIQTVKAPDVGVTLQIINITSDSIILNAQLDVSNPNRFDVDLKNIDVSISNFSGSGILFLQGKGGSISAGKNRTFFAQKTTGFSGTLGDSFTVNVKGMVGVVFLGLIEKQIPVSVHITVTNMEVIDVISIPKVNMDFKLDKLTKTGILFSGAIDFSNADTFDFYIQNISISILTEDGKNLLTLNNIPDGIISAQGSLSLPVTSEIQLEVFNSQKIFVQLVGDAGFHLLGLHKTFPIFAKIAFSIPTIQEFLNSTASIGISVYSDFKLTARGLLINLTYVVVNPFIIDITAYDIICTIYRIDNGVIYELGSTPLEACLISGNETNCQPGEILIPYWKLFLTGAHQILPDWFQLNLNMNFSVIGVNQFIPATFNAYLDVHLLR